MTTSSEPNPSPSDTPSANAAELQHIEGEFEINEKLKLYEQVWLPAQGAEDGSLHTKATVMLVHGFGEHSGRYFHVAKALVERNYAVYAYDQRGHGKSGGKRAFISQWDDYVNDFEVALNRVLESSGDLPLFILGHSMGGLVLASYLIKHKDLYHPHLQPQSLFDEQPMLVKPPIAGVVFSSSLLVMPNNVSPLLVSLSGFSAIAPGMKAIKVDPKTLSRDPAEVQEGAS